jgi:hypothetical protein
MVPAGGNPGRASASIGKMTTGIASALDRLEAVLRPGSTLRRVDGSDDAGIWSVFDNSVGPQQYDSIGGVYERLAGNREHDPRLVDQAQHGGFAAAHPTRKRLTCMGNLCRARRFEPPRSAVV